MWIYVTLVGIALVGMYIAFKTGEVMGFDRGVRAATGSPGDDSEWTSDIERKF